MERINREKGTFLNYRLLRELAFILSIDYPFY